MLTSFPNLCATLSAVLLNHPKKNTREFKAEGTSFSLPVEVVGLIYKKITPELLSSYEEKKPEAYSEFSQIRNMLRFFGAETQPTFDTRNGALNMMYAPSVCVPTKEIKEKIGNCELIIKFGNTSVPLVWDAETEKYKASYNGTFITLKPDLDKVNTKNGDLPIVKLSCRINGSEKSSEVFYSRVNVKRDEKDNSKDMVSAQVVQGLFEKGKTDKLAQIIGFPPSGGAGYTHRWSDDAFNFGIYPIVSLAVDQRKGTDGKRWKNYCVVVETEKGVKKMLLDRIHHTIFTTMSNFYTIHEYDEKGKLVNTITPYKKENNTELDLLNEISKELLVNTDNEKYAIVYSNKSEYFVKNNNGEQVKQYKVSLKFVPSNSDSWEPIPTKQIVPATQNNTQEPFVAGVDDLMLQPAF